MENQQPQKAAPVRQFSTRFLPSDGIPEYNALLDNHLGKRREFLLGNRHSLELMQQTGVIERVETQPDNPNQYVVHIAEKPIHRRKRLPPRSGSGSLQLPDSQTASWRQNSASRGILEGHASSFGHNTNLLRQGRASTSRLNPVDDFMDDNGVFDYGVSAAKKANTATLKGLSRSYSANTVVTSSCKPVLKSAAANRLALFGSTKCSALLESSGDGSFNLTKHRVASDVGSSSHHSEVSRQQSRSAIPAVFTPDVDTHKPKGIIPKRSVSSTSGGTPHSTVKGTVEHLLESDATFMTQIRTMKEHFAELENNKAYLDTEIGHLRRKLRGVNAVRENDVAVAHCSSIMQHRLSKAEEEYMKLVTQQQEVKKDVDRVRRELLSLRKVRHKLQEDIEDVAQSNQTFEEKIHAAKIVRNLLSEELCELERRAEDELEEQRLNLPPEDAVVVDVAKLMGAVQERNSARRYATVGLAETGSSSRTLTALQLGSPTPSKNSTEKAPRSNNDRRGSRSEHPKTLLDYCTAFRVLQNSMGFDDLAAFEQQFTATEEQLLSKYKANLTLADEVAALEKELSAVSTEKKVNRANVREIIQANDKMERNMQIRIQTVLASIRSYNELREQRNREHAKLRGIMLRCLDALQIDAGGSEAESSDGSGDKSANSGTGGASSTHSLYWTETQSPELLEMLQRKMTQVAVTLKVKHSSRILELPPEALRLNRGHDGRRSNMFSTRESSKIVLGPREPSGSALAAILGTVQPPSVENAIALTENANMLEVMHGLHRAISPARRKASSLSLIPPEMGKLDVPRGSASSSTPVEMALLNAEAGQARSLNPNTLSPVQGLPSRPSLAMMAEADTEDDDEDDNDGEEPELQDENENDDVESPDDDDDDDFNI